MYTEREMLLDSLETVKTGTTELTKFATEISNPPLRQTVIQMRNRCEQMQQTLAQTAQSLNIYIPAPPAAYQDVANVAQFLQQTVGQPATV